MPPKRRRRFQGLYYHSSPPKVIPMNGQLSNQNGRKRREVDDFSVKLSTIRIWMHEKDIGNLTRILWAGQGNRLRQQASTNPKVKRFLAAVPYVMNSIKDVHQAVIDNNLETLQATLEPPVPPALITCKDANGLNAIHKAAGMGHTKILEYLIETWPDGINEIDITGKTPLHWAASAKNNMRCYTLLTQAGCDEEVVDYKMKTPSYYRHKPHEIERAFLVYVPEAPRVSPGIATDWEALCDDGGDGKKLEIKIPEINGVSLRTTDDSIDITSDADLNDSVSGTEEDEVAKDDEVQPVENGVESVPETPDNLDEEAEPELELVPEPELEPKTKPEPEEEETDDVVAPAPEEEDENPENNSLIETTMTTDKDDNDQAEENDNDQTEKDGSSQTDVDEKGGDIEAIEESAQVEKNDDDKESAQQNEAMSNVDHDDEATADVGEKDEENTNDNDKEAVKDEEDIANSDNEEQLELNVNANNNDDIKDNKTNEINDEDIVEMQTNDRELVDDDTNNMNESIVNANEEQNTTPNNEETDKTEDIMNIDSNTSETNEENDKNENEAADNENNKIVFINVKTDLETGEETVVEKNKLIENTEESKETVGEDAEEPADEKEVTENGEDSNKIKENGVSTDKNGTKTTKSDAEEDEEEDEDLKEQFDDNDDITGAETELVFDEQETVTGEPEPEPEPKVELYAETDEPLDENHNADKYDSPTSSLAIEGFVQGESEDNTVQSQSAAFVDEASRIQEIIASGDMEQLAEIVLNGDGSKLLDMQSPEAEIQAFLNNVPNYMGKIRRVHEAAREGSLLSLQQALDRRKFAIAKDEISPNGATPLHVAVLFGHTDIVRYLAARFTETTTATDNDGRTALHYAATIKDNGHFYNLLAQLGANPKSVDKLGHTPEFFLDAESSQDILSYRQLLSSFGAADLEQALLSDQVPDDLHSSRRQLQDGDIVRTMERCFNVIQESSKVLSGATASALKHRKPLSASSLQLTVTSYLSRFLKPSVYEKIKHRQTRLDHNLFDVIWPAMRKTSKLRHLEEDINCGIVAPDFDVFVVYQEFLVPLIKDMHCMSIAAEFKPHPRIAYFPMENGERLNTAAFNFDDDSNLIQRCFVECSRNLEEFELPLNLTIGQIEQAERIMMGKIFTVAFAEAIGENESGSYYTLTEILEENSEVLEMLNTLGLMIPLLNTKESVQAAESMAFNGSLWPYGRGVYVNSDSNLALWLNCQEHLRVISTTNSKDSSNMGAAYTRVGRAVSYLEGQLHFKESYLLGYLQARPSYLGTGLKLSTTIRLPNLMKEMDNLRHLCSVRGLSLITSPITKLTVRLMNMQSLGAMEYVLFQDYCTALTNILSLEKDMSLTNSKHIATMLVKIFRRKKNSLVDRN